MDFMGDLIPLAGIFAIFICPVIMVILIVWIKHNAKSKQEKLRTELLIKAMESGQTIPDNFFVETEQKINLLQKSLPFIAIGVGGIAFFVLKEAGMQNNAPFFAVGLAFLAVGIGYLLIHFFDKKQEEKEENESDK